MPNIDHPNQRAAEAEPEHFDDILSADQAEREQGLAGFIKQFGFDISELDPGSVMKFVAARNLAKHIEKLKIPVAAQITVSGKMQLVEREIEEVIEHTSYREHEEKSDTPADNMNLDMVSGPQDLPEVVPSEWLLDDVAPDLFLQRLAQREALKREWRQVSRKPETSYETVKRKEVFEAPAPPESERQHAYVLIDTSGSMGAGDGREIVAAGLALAFLLKGHKEGSNLNFRPFAGGVHKQHSAKSDVEFKAMASAILRLNSGGGTNICGALETAVRDIKAGGEFSRADILLITDGLSDLYANPLGQVKLHSFVVGNILSGLRDLSDRRWAKRNLKELKNWSDNFKKIGTRDIKHIITPSDEDLAELESMVRSIGGGVPYLTTQEQYQSTLESIDEAQRLVRLLQEIDDKHESRLKKIESVLDQIQEELSQSDLETLFEENKQRIQAEQAMQAELEAARQSQALADAFGDLESLKQKMGSSAGQHNPTNSNPQSSHEQPISLWQQLKRWAKSVSYKIGVSKY